MRFRDAALLAIIESGQNFGADVIRAYDGLGVELLQRGAAYDLLDRLRESGLVKIRETAPPEWRGNTRDIYEVTDAGRDYLRAFIEATDRIKDMIPSCASAQL